MNRKEKRAWWWYIVMNDPQYNFGAIQNESFIELSMGEIERLGNYASIFGIRPKDGKSPAKYLWDNIKNEEPF